jgi:membrane-anchored protein YejM (alkaline phosphatase superfamily)
VAILVNVAALALFYAWRSKELIAVGGVTAHFADCALVVAHVLWVAPLWGAPFVVIKRKIPAALWWALLWWLVLIDSRVYLLLGVHLTSSVVTRTLTHEHALDELQLGAATLWTAALLYAGLFAAELGLHRATEGRLRPRLAWAALALALGACVVDISGRQGRPAVVDALPFTELPRFLPPGGGDEIHYPRLEAETVPRITRRMSVLVVFIESLRADAVEAMPRLRQFAADRGTLASQRHYSAAHSTEYATFALLYGLGADHQVAFTHPPGVPSWPLSLFRLNGYDVRAASASFLSGWNQSGRITKQFQDYRELLGDPIWNNDARVVDYARRFQAERDPKRPFFLFLFLNSTHHAYFYPPEHEKRRPAISEVQNRLVSDEELGRSHQVEVKNRYLNSVEWVDRQLGEILDLFAGEIARGELAVVVTGDHGEEMWDRGLYGHAAPTLTNARILVPLTVSLPGETRRELTLTSHADVMPTLVDALQLEPPVPPATWSTGRSLLRPDADPRILVHASGYPYGDRSSRVVCVIDGHKKYRVRREYGRVPRYTLVSVTDMDDQPLAAGAEEQAAFARISESLAHQALRFLR